ncbi:MAG: cytochrome c biogenesis protein [Bacteroidales bacterium]|nr:cytochrome c biogenesis protein [Bacteroidales bacterium]
MEFLKNSWWKIFGVIILLYVIAGGLLFEAPQLPVIRETVRNIYFHVGMWFSMMFILFMSLFFSLRYLRYFRPDDDLRAVTAVKTGLVFGTLGLLTGMIWANNTWGSFWVNDPKLNGAAVGMLTYLAYMVLRGSVDEHDKKARLSAVYNIFAFVLFFVFIMILPRLSQGSIHPGIEGNPALSTGDLDPRMRKVFFPAIAGWIIMAWWLFRVYFRILRLRKNIDELNEND